jgi:hypothetical protein
MTSTSAIRFRSGLRPGISLLEVLISIGILSVGLLATLALIPAGRTYMKKAAVDDRAAAIVPNAYATLTQLGLLRAGASGALSWQDIPVATFDDGGEPDLVIREQAGFDVFGKTPNGLTHFSGWTIRSTDTAVTQAWHPAAVPAELQAAGGVLTGSVVSGTVPRTVTVSGSMSYVLASGTPTGTPSPAPGGVTLSNTTTSKWQFVVPISPLTLTAPRMEIWPNGPNVGKPKNNTIDPLDGQEHNSSARYKMTGIYSYASGTTTVTGTSIPAPSTWLLFGQRRAQDKRTGRARTTYNLPSAASDANGTPGTATTVALPRLENTKAKQAGTIARSVSCTVYGHLWRMETGTREGTYEQLFDFDDADMAADRPQPAVFPDADIARNAGDIWIDRQVHEDVDWYRYEVNAGESFTLSWDDPGNLLTGEVTADAANKFPVYLNTINPLSPLTPISALTTGTSRTYSIPNDGYVLTRAMLRPVTSSPPDGDIPTLLNTFGPIGASVRQNPAYALTATRTRTDRVVVIDPLMASRLDHILTGAPAANNFDPRYLRRHRFADFQQFFAGNGSPRAFVIPRINWQKFDSPDVDSMVAMSEWLFRDQDSIAFDLPANADDAPVPLFDLNAGNRPARRRSEGKMSWLVMLQPEDPGPVADNWNPGKYFDVSTVIFENRPIPPLGAAPPLDGEYAFSAEWNAADGLVTVTVPAAAELDQDDVRNLFKTGAWVLLAPQVAYESTPLDSTQRLDWIRIQSARLGNDGSGGTAVQLLLEEEPAPDILNSNAVRVPLVVLAYQGVVAVVNKSMQLR